MTLQSTHMFHGAELERDATLKVWALNLTAATTSATARIIGFRDTTGTQHARVYFTLTPKGGSSFWLSN